mgnify:CR=1 FL=1
MLCSGFSVHLGLMTETNESQENQNEEEAAVPTMTTVERAEMLLQQDAAIRAKINGGAALDEAVARIKLAAMGVAIDTLSTAQEEYLGL